MRLSVTIAATLAAITGSINATPGLLHARALEQVNSFERDVDIYSRNDNHQVLHRRTASKVQHGISATREAIQRIQSAIDHGPPHEQEMWSDHKTRQTKTHDELVEMHKAHSDAAKQEHPTDLVGKVREASKHAGEIADEAHYVNMQAQG